MGWIILIICGTICALVGNAKGRNPVAWFLLGFFFHIFALIAVLICSNKKEAREKEENMRMEQRRLQEQLRQERLKNEMFRKHTQTRLDTHDNILQIDSRNTQAQLETSDNPIFPEIPSSQQDPVEPLPGQINPSEEIWYYMSGNNTAGPFSLEQINDFLLEGKMDPLTMIWTQTYDKWVPAGEVIDSIMGDQT